MRRVMPGLLLILGLALPAEAQFPAQVIAALRAYGLIDNSCTDGQIIEWDTTTRKYVCVSSPAGSAPSDATFITQTPNATLTNEQALSALSSGLLTVTTGTGVVASTVPGTGVLTALGVNVGSAGAFVTFNGALGTPSAGTLTNATGLPISTGVSGLGTGVATFLATPSSANLAAAVTGETGTDGLVFATSPSLTTPTIAGATLSGSLAGTPTFTGVFSNTAFGIHSFLTAGNGSNILRNRNTEAGVDRQASFQLGNDAAADRVQLRLWSTTHNGTGSNLPDTFNILSEGVNGIALSATDAAGTLRIYTGGTAERMRVAANGNVGIGDTSPDFGLDVETTAAFPNIAAGAAGDTDMCLNATTNEATDAAASTCIVSSLRFKNWIGPLSNPLAQVRLLEPGIYRYKPEMFDAVVSARERVGFTAENMAAVEPRLTFYEPDGITPRTINFEEYTALLTGAVKELDATTQSRLDKQLDLIEGLLRRVELLEADNARLRGR